MNDDISTLLIHSDDGIEATADLAAPMHLSNTFVANNNDGLIYSREDNITRRRVEKILSDIESGSAVAFSSGQAATFSLLMYVKPKRIMATKGYFGTTDIIDLYCSIANASRVDLSSDVQDKDFIWIETPINPSGKIINIKDIVDSVRSKNVIIAVDSTLATPIFQKPLRIGADYVVHSMSKYIGGHSDIISGIVVSKHDTDAIGLKHLRNMLGNVPGSIEMWLILRSLKTLDLRVKRQFTNASNIALWLKSQKWVKDVTYVPKIESSNQDQLMGSGAVFCALLCSATIAENLPKYTKVFTNATSIGGAESLIEWRHKFDPNIDRSIVRISIGLENIEDLKNDLHNAYSKLCVEQV